MLSKTSIVILGMLCEEDLGAYEMLKKIEHMDMKYWWPIGDTTLYETAIRLEKKNYIEGSQQNTKVIYTITDRGKEELKSAIRTLFLRMDYDTIWFSLAIMYCSILEKEELTLLIQKRKDILQEYYDGIQTKLNRLNTLGKLPYQDMYAIERMLQITELELKSITEFQLQNS